MALRVVDTTSGLHRDNPGLSPSAITLAALFYTGPLSGSSQLLIMQYNDASGNGISIGLDEASKDVVVYSYAAGAPVALGTVAANRWYFIAFVGSGTGANGLTGYLGEAGSAAALASAVTDGDNVGVGSTALYVSSYYGSFAGSRLAGIKVWSAALTAAELERERRRITPARGADLWSWAPAIHSTTSEAAKDFSGNGRDWTVDGTLAVDDGPPVGWGAPLALVGAAAASGSTGTLAATESGADTAALVGVALVDGSLAATESGSDVAALIGVALVSGTLAATETGDDAAVIAGSVLAQGTLAATESGSDVAAIEGVTVNVATGSLAATESGSDTAEIVGVVLARGTLAANDSGEDTAAITGVALVSGTLDATEAGSDTAVIAAVALVQGSLDATESGIDTAAIEGSLAVISTGSLAATESGSDTATFAGVAPVSGALSATEAANDSAAVSGVVLVTGALDATETGSDTAAFASSTPVTTAYPGPAGRATKGKRRRVVIRERVYEVNERDLPALLEAELLDRAPPVTAEVVEGPKPPRKRGKKAPQPVKTVEQVQEAVAEIKARIEPDNGWLMQALEAVALRVLERIQDEEDSLILLLAA